MMKSLLYAAISLGLVASAFAQDAKKSYFNDFEKAELDKLPDEFQLLDGGFAVKQESGNKFLELPGAPLDSFGVLFGPADKEGLSVSARIYGTSKGRRSPTFGVGLNGVGGYKLQVSPAKKLVELYKGETVQASVPFEWKSGKWTYLNLKLIKASETEWKVEGKVWNEDSTQPAAPTISHMEKEQPYAGRPSIFGSPFATTPIRYDDLKVDRIGS